MEETGGARELLQERQLNLQEKSRNLENDKRVLMKNSVEYLKDKGLYHLTNPDLDKIPCGNPIPIDQLETYDPGR
jgi:hypothetical protein